MHINFMVFHRHVCFVFLPNTPIGIIQLAYCLSRTFPKTLLLVS